MRVKRRGESQHGQAAANGRGMAPAGVVLPTAGHANFSPKLKTARAPDGADWHRNGAPCAVGRSRNRTIASAAGVWCRLGVINIARFADVRAISSGTASVQAASSAGTARHIKNCALFGVHKCSGAAFLAPDAAKRFFQAPIGISDTTIATVPGIRGPNMPLVIVRRPVVASWGLLSERGGGDHGLG
jgi:hypothetical protein